MIKEQKYKYRHTNSLRCWVGTDPIQYSKITRPPGNEPELLPVLLVTNRAPITTLPGVLITK